jgi:hypothetical protein
LCQEKSGNPVLLHKDLIRDFLLYVCCHQWQCKKKNHDKKVRNEALRIFCSE